MGFQRKKNVYKLRFEDEEYEGFVVKAYSPSVGFITSLSKLSGSSTDNIEVNEENQQALEFLTKGFSDCLVEWNLENEDGTPVPATYEGLMSQDIDFVMYVTQSWIESVAGVSAPKEQPSTGGSQFPEASTIPMEAL